MEQDIVEKIGRGAWWGMLPKVGSKGLILYHKHRVGDWKFNIRGMRLSPGEYWFQMQSDEGEWLWSHGVVEFPSGNIKQIG